MFTAALVESPEPSLEDLMERYASGDFNAFEKLYRLMAPKLYIYLVRLGRDPVLAEDILQITFAKIHRARHTYAPGSAVVPWVLVIARRAFLDERRSASSRWEVLSDDGTVPELVVAEGDANAGASTDMARVLEALPEHYRAAIELTKLGGLTGTEAARALRTTPSAVKLRVHRGYKLLRELLAQDLDMPPAELERAA
jgi:RNA polymerase sigma-70 factor, ECF subfamily